jgi:uncharacterized membrane protein YhaH (DUF805 family)
MVDKGFMRDESKINPTTSWTRLLFDDEGMISRKTWWAGTLLLVFLHGTAEFFSSRILATSDLARPFMLFVSLAILVPFYSVNAKRFRAIGRSPSKALIGGILPGLVILCDVYLAFDTLNITFGLAMLGVMIWYILDLGVFDHDMRPVLTIDDRRRHV